MRHLLLVLLLVAACSSDDDDATTTAGAGSEATTSTTTTTSTTAFEGTTTRTSEPGTGPIAHLADVRVSDDRVAFEFREGEGPGFDVGYVDEARASGSGHRVEVEGDAFLEVRMEPASGVDLSGDEIEETYQGRDRIDGTGPITEVVRTGDFEANLTWVIGLDRERPFRILELTGPTRLVVLIGP